MLCSISTGKSSSNWLDRLRSSKGFPSGDDLDLEQFLNHHNSNLSNSSDAKLADSTADDIAPNSNSNQQTQSFKRSVVDRNEQAETSSQIGENELFSTVNHVLAELFNMGDSNHFPRINGKKSSRKQASPRICVVSTSMNVDGAGKGYARRDDGGSPALPSSGDSSHVGMKEMNHRMKPTDQKQLDNAGQVHGEEEENSHADLSSFSRTEVTVIDTSCLSWKFEKLLFRRKNVWKVRDKKSKASYIGKKKRKASSLDESTVGEKKPKPSVTQCDSAKEGIREEDIMPIPEGCHWSHTTKKTCKETPGIFCQAPKKRFPKKFKRKDSSVILIKNIPTSKKNGASIPKSLKTSQRQIKC